MAFDFAGMLSAVQSMVATLPLVVSTQAGLYGSIPESFIARINVIVAMGKANPEYDSMGGQTWRPEVYVLLAYRVAGAEAAAEVALATLYLQLIDAVVADQTLGGMCDPGEIRIESDEGLRPIFEAVAGAEMRFYPVRIIGHQQRDI